MGKHESSAAFYWLYRRTDGYLGKIKAPSEDAAHLLLRVLPQNYTILTHVLSLEEAHERINNERYGNV